MDIQEWLGHSDIATTSNIYTHLDYSSKVASANAIIGFFPGSEEDKKDENKETERIFLSSGMSSEKPKKRAVKAKTGGQKAKKARRTQKKAKKRGRLRRGRNKKSPCIYKGFWCRKWDSEPRVPSCLSAVSPS